MDAADFAKFKEIRERKRADLFASFQRYYGKTIEEHEKWMASTTEEERAALFAKYQRDPCCCPCHEDNDAD